MSPDPFAGLLDPLAGWDIPGTYQKYSGFIDLLIYCTIFVALAQAVFGRRFPGRPGKALATVIGLALGLSLTVMAHQFGWNLGKASPIAILLLLLLVGFLILHTMLRLGVSWTLAAPLTFVLLYLFLRAASPEFMRAVTERAPFVHLLAALFFLICLWKIGVSIWPKGENGGDSQVSDAGFLSQLNRKKERDELRIDKRIKNRMVPKARKKTKVVEHDLESLKGELEKENPNWGVITEACPSIAKRSDEVVQIVDRIRTLDRRIKNFDWQELEHLRSYYRELSKEEREKLREQILLEHSKVVHELEIERVTERCERRYQDFRQMLVALDRSARQKDRRAALESVSAAISLENAQKEELNKVAEIEKRLIFLTKKKLRKEKSIDKGRDPNLNPS